MKAKKQIQERFKFLLLIQLNNLCTLFSFGKNSYYIQLKMNESPKSM
jgi:hypothetical protein